jgi:hypothetical protein
LVAESLTVEDANFGQPFPLIPTQIRGGTFAKLAALAVSGWRRGWVSGGKD